MSLAQLARKLERNGHDENAYAKFIAAQKEKLIRYGMDEPEAQHAAEQLAAMYRHHFRNYN